VENPNPVQAALINATRNAVKSDLISATRHGSLTAIEALISSLGDANAPATKSTVTSAVASSIFDDFGEGAMVLLTRTGLPVDTAGVTGNTFLMWSAVWCKPSIASSLLSLGADYSLKNGDGLTPLAIARQNGCSAVVQALRSAGAVV